MQNKMETAGELVSITVSKGKCFALDRTPWCKNTNSLHGDIVEPTLTGPNSMSLFSHLHAQCHR